MPPRWPRKPDRADPAFRRLDDRMTFATHVAAFAAVNSGLWFFRIAGEKLSETALPGGLPGTPWITSVWAIALISHGIFIFALAQYPDTAPPPSPGGTGFGSNSGK